MIHKCKKRCWRSLMIREIQIEPCFEAWPCTLLGWRPTGSPLHCCRWYKSANLLALGKTRVEYLYLPRDPAVLLPGVGTRLHTFSRKCAKYLLMLLFAVAETSVSPGAHLKDEMMYPWSCQTVEQDAAGSVEKVPWPAALQKGLSNGTLSKKATTHSTIPFCKVH